MERPGRSEVASKLENRSLAPFPADRLTWSDADFEKAHKRMARLSYIGGKTGQETSKALGTLSDALEDDAGETWEKQVATFSPEQVLMRYGGNNWSYAFHEQRKLEEGKTTQASGHENESSVTGIAKRIVREMGKLVKEAKRNMDATTDVEERNHIGEELVGQVENVMDDIYRKDMNRDHIKVTCLDGPRGPVYLCTQNGNHRLAAARLIGLRRVRGEVETFKDGKGLEHWYDFLAMMPAEARAEWMENYDTLYTSTEDDREEDLKMLEEASVRRPVLLEAVTRRRQLRDQEAEIRNREYRKKEADAKRRYAEVDEKSELYKKIPGFQSAINTAAVSYYSGHSDDYVRTNYFLEPDERGVMPTKRPDRGFGSHVLAIDIDGAPLQTHKEILWMAIVAFEKEHPELSNPFDKNRE